MNVLDSQYDDAMADVAALYAPISLPGGWAGGVKGTRRAEFTFCGGGNSQFSGNLVDSHQRLMFKLPITTTRWRLRIGNNNLRHGRLPRHARCGFDGCADRCIHRGPHIGDCAVLDEH
jgi:hypothetical protein